MRAEFEVAWPGVAFVFSESGKDYFGMLDDCDTGKCDAMAASLMETSGDIELTKAMCKRKLVFTDSLIIENVSLIPRYNIVENFRCSLSFIFPLYYLPLSWSPFQ